MAGERRRWGRHRGLHRIEDRPEHHDAPGAWPWDRAARRRRDARADLAARRYLARSAAAEECWRCEAAVAIGRLGLCRSCLDDLQRS